MIWYVVFLIIVAVVFYLVNWVLYFPGKCVVTLPVVGYLTIPQVMIDVFLVLIFIFGFLQMLGVERGTGFPVPK